MPRFYKSLLAALTLIGLTVFISPLAFAAEPNTVTPEGGQPGNFSLQVTPSPLVTTVQPGVPSTVELKIRNGGSTVENLKIEPRSFTLSSTDNQVALNDTTPPDISRWIKFSSSRFSVQPGEWYTERIQFALPKESGFSYSFALIVSRQSEPQSTSAGRLLKGSVAIFSLVNVDRPGATKKLEVANLSTDHKVYEFLPTKVNISIKNTGNTIIQPYGNVFIGRSANEAKPLATLAVNQERGYILPDATRQLTALWQDGFPKYNLTTNQDGSESRSLEWKVTDVSKYRIGKYTAKLVAVYNDGTRDVPIEGEVSFWVIPWKTVSILLVVIAALIYLSRVRSKRRTDKAVKKALQAQKKK